MDSRRKLYPTFYNPLLIKPERPLPREVAMVGAGTIGPDIGYYLKSALPDIKLILVDVVEEPLKNAEKRLAGYAKKGVDTGRMKEDQARAVLENIVYTTDYSAIRNCDLVIEAATENIPLKQRIFAQVEELVGEDTIITSNTSSIPADRLFLKMKRPERTTVTHFFAPAWRSLPVEVIRWEKADPQVVDYLFWMFAATGKAPLITDNAICFMLDRIFDNWADEAGYLLNVATAAQIDEVAEEFVSAGPFFVVNMSNGNPIIIETNTLQMEEGAHYRPAPIFLSVAQWATKRPGTKVDVPDDVRKAVRDRLLGVFFSQSFDVVDRGIGTREDLEFGCKIALGFRKGPFDVMKDIGEAEVRRIQDRFITERPGFPVAQKPLSEYQNFRRYVLVDEIEGVRIITIRRPEAMNALNPHITDEILSALQEGVNDPSVKGFVITGYGTAAFSAGADIGKFPQVLGDKEAAIKYTREYAKVQAFLDGIEKPVVAAVNGMALGGGFEVALRCHSIVATRKARFQFPEITLGILPGVGGCVVPYRRWPDGAKLFHEMICLARPLNARDAAGVGMVSKLVDDYYEMIQEAVKEVNRLQGKVTRVPDGKVAIPEIEIPEQPMAGSQPLSREAISITVRTIKNAAAAGTFAQALEVGYDGFGDIACIEAAREGITAFLEKRKPEFRK